MGSNKKVGIISFLFSFIIGMLVGILERMRYKQGFEDGQSSMVPVMDSDEEEMS